MTYDQIDVLWQFVAKQATKERRVPLYHFADLVAAAEREACAKVCEAVDEADTRYRYDYRRGVLDCADAIRARGEKK